MKKIIIILMLISTIFIVGCNTNTIEQDKELCEMKGFDYHTSSHNNFVECLDNGILMKIHYTEYNVMKSIQRNKINCKEVYIEHLIKVGENSSFELTKCKENGLTLDVKEILY